MAEVLADEEIKVGEHDIVAPGLDETVDDGTRISVRFGRQLTLTVDGDVEREVTLDFDETDDLSPAGDVDCYAFEVAERTRVTLATETSNCNTSAITLNTPYPIKTGNMVGPTNSGVDALIALDPDQQPILWPEHFDVAILLDDRSYGSSPGDDSSPAPYAYGRWNRSWE